MEKWFLQTKKADFAEWARELGIDPVTARILRNRDVENLEEARRFLYGELKDMYNPFLMKDMDKAAVNILSAIESGMNIRVIGDYDVDGITSSFILTRGLELLGAKVSYSIPHRIHDGYGLSDGLVEDCARDGINLIITCDNGISAGTQIELALSLGIDVIVTDHHEIPFEIDENGIKKQVLPNALAVVNPHRYDDEYPFKGICGAMVAFKLMQALQEKSGSLPLKEAMEELTVFAALGTVCDVMELRDENRILVKEGLKLIKRTRNNGLKALIEVNTLSIENISTYHLGFVIGPCINATGRLDSATRALELFLTKDFGEAILAATELKELNESRKNLTNDGIEQAESYISNNNLLQKDVWIIFLPDVHESIAGIIAGKIREKYNHPVFVLTRGEGLLKGSGRSIEGYHMQEKITMLGNLLEKFGGHAMAAGLSVKEENLLAFENGLNQNSGLSKDDFVASIHIDVPMPLVYGNLTLAEELEKLAPFGNGNATPLFAQKDLIFEGMNRFGKEKQYARIRALTPEGRRVELTSFINPEDICKYIDEKYGTGSGEAFSMGRESFKMNVAYQLNINTFRGETNLQYQLKHYC